MSLVVIHRGLANASTLFMAALAIWAFVLWLRSRALDSNWFGAAVIGEILVIAQFLVGWLLWFQGMGADLPRPWIHILYGMVAVITLPAGYTYFNNIKNPRVQTLAMTFICAFLWGIILRAAQVATMAVPY